MVKNKLLSCVVLYAYICGIRVMYYGQYSRCTIMTMKSQLYILLALLDINILTFLCFVRKVHDRHTYSSGYEFLFDRFMYIPSIP